MVSNMPKVMRGRPISSRSSSSGSSIGQQSVIGNRLTSTDKTATKSRLLQPRVSSKSHSFMRPTAASVNKGSIPNLPRSIKAMVK